MRESLPRRDSPAREPRATRRKREGPASLADILRSDAPENPGGKTFPHIRRRAASGRRADLRRRVCRKRIASLDKDTSNRLRKTGSAAQQRNKQLTPRARAAPRRRPFACETCRCCDAV